jgi:hypothetical protein
MRLYSGLFLVIVLVMCATPVSAHFLETDGTIGAVLHLDPNDDPIAGQASAFFLEFKDKSGRFQPLSCTCSAEIYEGKQKVASLPLFAGDGSRLDSSNGQATGNASFTFPTRDAYVMKVVGVPTQDGLFQPFALSYSIRVDRDVASASSRSPLSAFLSGHSSYGVLVGSGLAVTVMYFIVGYIRKRKGNS